MTTLCQSNYCTADEHRLSLRSARLENEYQEALHRRNTLISEEKHRLLRVNAFLLENENDELNGQLQRASNQLEATQVIESHLQDQLREAEHRHASSQNMLRAKSREISSLKSEIASLNDNSLDSNKILTEKLGLSRELSSAREELEHLRSQSESYQTLLTEKHSLERQLSSLEVELDTAKRALERARAKDDSQNEDDASAKFQLEEMNKELARERKERERIENESRKHAAQWDTERENLESKLDVFREEIRQARNQSGDGRDEFHPPQKLGSESRSGEEQELQRRNSRKRSIPHFDPDMTIGTPGDFNQKKKIKPVSALPGDKSMFSITPFLSRTSMSLESQIPDSSSDSNRELNSKKTGKHDSAVVSKGDVRVKQKAPRASATKPRGTAGKPAQEAKGSNSKIRVRGSSTSALEKVPEENGDETETRGPDTLIPEASTGDAEKPKLKKQKFLGASREPTLFDEDEQPDWPQQNRRPGPGRSLGTLGGINLTTSKSLHRGETTGQTGGRPEFSPLKKNRRPL